MKCAYHPDRDAVAACVNCGRLVCPECKVVLSDKNYCNPCADKVFESTISRHRGKRPNWFRRHLNWTVFLSWLVMYPLDFAVAFLIAIVWYFNDPSVNEKDVEVGAIVILLLVNVVIMLLVCTWALREKARSLWNLLWLIVPFGLWIFLALENRSSSGGVEQYGTQSSYGTG